MEIGTSKFNSPQLHPILLEKNALFDTKTIQPRKTSVSLYPVGLFRAEILIGEKNFIQRFSFFQKDDSVILKNNPTDSFPNIEIILKRKESKVEVKDFKIERSDNTVWGELQYTRIFLMLSEIKKCSISIKDIGFSQFNLSFNELEKEQKKYMLYRAKLARKLRFLEIFFKTSFNLPENFDGNDIRQIEVLFQGITEGEFTIPVGSFITVFNYKLTSEDLRNFAIPQKRWFSFEFNEDFRILDKFFKVGKIILSSDKVAITNPKSLRNFGAGEIVPQLRLSVFDYQVRHSFEKYIDKERLIKNKQKLEQFKNTLRKEEPEFLVNLLNEPLSEVTEKAAIEVITGWLQYYDFPDRYTVGEPILEGENWRVPILLTYPKEKTVWIEDAFVNLKTGIIEIKSSPEKLRKKGKKKAEEVLSVA